jgi:hypothetical protein
VSSSDRTSRVECGGIGIELIAEIAQPAQPAIDIEKAQADPTCSNPFPQHPH